MTDDVRLVTVLKTGDEAAIAVARSLLEEAGIEYLIRHQGLHALFPVEQYQLHFQVRQEDEQEALALLQELRDT